MKNKGIIWEIFHRHDYRIYFGNSLKQRFGFDYMYANELEIENGELTGRYVGDVVDGKRKAELLRLLCQFEGINIAQVQWFPPNC